MSLADRTIGDFLAAIASEAPAPGAGASAAVALAIGLACARKAVALTLKHRPERSDLRATDKRLARLIERSLAGGEADARRFGDYIEALARPAEEPDRDEVEREALTDLVGIDGDLIAICDEAEAKLRGIRDDIHPPMANDMLAALALISAARTIYAACISESQRTLG